MRNVAQGIKSYSILRLLYDRGTLREDEGFEAVNCEKDDRNEASTASACIDGRKGGVLDF